MRADPKLSRDLAPRASVGRKQHDTRTPRDTLRRPARTNPAVEKASIVVGDAKPLLPHGYHHVDRSPA
jgi:hypothetical protein